MSNGPVLSAVNSDCTSIMTGISKQQILTFNQQGVVKHFFIEIIIFVENCLETVFSQLLKVG